MQTPSFSNQKFDIYIDDNNICVVVYKFKNVLELNDVKELVAKRLEICNYENYPILVENNSSNNSTNEAKNYLISQEGQKGISACALVFNNTISYYAYKFILSFNAHTFPTKVFNNKDKAVEWLKNYANI